MAALKSIAGRSMSELVENHLSSAKNATAVTVLARIALSMRSAGNEHESNQRQHLLNDGIKRDGSESRGKSGEHADL